jgi:hypothetical protein
LAIAVLIIADAVAATDSAATIAMIANTVVWLFITATTTTKMLKNVSIS